MQKYRYTQNNLKELKKQIKMVGLIFIKNIGKRKKHKFQFKK